MSTNQDKSEGYLHLSPPNVSKTGQIKGILFRGRPTATRNQEPLPQRPNYSAPSQPAPGARAQKQEPCSNQPNKHQSPLANGPHRHATAPRAKARQTGNPPPRRKRRRGGWRNQGPKQAHPPQPAWRNNDSPTLRGRVPQALPRSSRRRTLGPPVQPPVEGVRDRSVCFEGEAATASRILRNRCTP